MNEKEVATKILAAMDMHEKSFQVGRASSASKYTKSLRQCFDEIFGDNPFKEVYYLATYLAWNDMESWARVYSE